MFFGIACLSIVTKLEILRQRQSIFQATRDFFVSRDFVEIHTPLLVKNPGLEPYLHHFPVEFTDAHGRPSGRKAFLPTSPEYHLKKALALGFDKVFEITRSFRNGEFSDKHEPEFFMLEWYRHPGSYVDIAQDFAALMAELGKKFDPRHPWHKRQDMTVKEAFQRFASVDLDEALLGQREGKNLLARLAPRFSVDPNDSFEDSFFKIVIEAIEPKLGFEGPCFLWDYPADQCAMARVKKEAPLYCERFEVYWKGIELANAFGELTDSAEQKKRCLEDQKKRIKLYGTSPELDEDFFEALKKLSTAGGIAVGFDRLIQCLLGQARVQDVIAFPHSTR